MRFLPGILLLLSSSESDQSLFGLIAMRSSSLKSQSPRLVCTLNETTAVCPPTFLTSFSRSLFAKSWRPPPSVSLHDPKLFHRHFSGQLRNLGVSRPFRRFFFPLSPPTPKPVMPSPLSSKNFLGTRLGYYVSDCRGSTPHRTLLAPFLHSSRRFC